MANRLFSMLTLAEQVVVLLDEFDEMGRDRARSEEILSRFITTAMLPKLAKINEERKIVFLLATNYVSGFDAAFSRGGRFDMLIQVMPPNLKAKLARWPDLRERLEALDGEKKQLVAKLRQAKAAAEIEMEIETAWGNCTLNKPNDIERGPRDDKGTSPTDPTTKVEAQKERKGDTATWRQTSKAERQQIRLPGI
jgi:ATP-dependent 26S proteasome regulatory subunit